MAQWVIRAAAAETRWKRRCAKRKELIQEYKLTEPVAGIYRIRSKETGRVLIGSSLNLHGPLNRHRLQLEVGSHRSERLQKDWNALGPEAFAFEMSRR